MSFESRDWDLSGLRTVPAMLPKSLVFALAVLGLSFCANVFAQPIWVAPWSGTQVPAASDVEYSTAAFSPDGELVVAIDRSFDTQLIRVDKSGLMRWDQSISRFGTTPGTLVAQADGSALFDSGKDGDGYVGKIGSDGSFAWLSKQKFGSALSPVGADRAMSASCISASTPRLVVTMFNTATGSALWERDVAVGGNGCEQASIVGNGHSDGYVNYGGSLRKFTATGSLAWSVNAAQSYLLGASDDYLYVDTGAGVQARRSMDGTLAWTSNGSVATSYSAKPTRWLIADGELIASISGAIVRLDSATGAAKWSTPIWATAIAPTLIDGNVVTVTIANGLEISRLDPTSGALLGTTQIESGTAITVLSVGRTGYTGIGVLARIGDDAPSGPPRLYRIDSGSGEALTPLALPRTPTTISAIAFIDGGTDIVSLGRVIQLDGVGTVVRSLRPTDGAVLWQAGTSTLPLTRSDWWPSLALTSNLAVISLAGQTQFWYDPNFGKAMVVALDRATGARRWITALGTVGQQDTYVSEPVADAAGDVYVELGADSVPCPPTIYPCMRKSLIKLAATDGHVVWQRDVYEPGGWIAPYPYLFVVVGNYLVTNGAFDEYVDLTREVGLSLMDGKPQWRTAPLAEGGAFRMRSVDAEHFLAWYAGQVSRITTGTGVTEWTIPSFACPSQCVDYDFLPMPNGDLISVGESGRAGYVSRLRADGSTWNAWHQVLPDADMGSRVGSVKNDANGNVWVRMTQRWLYDGSGLQILARFDPVSMSLQGQQVTSSQWVDASYNFFLGSLERAYATQALVSSWERDGTRIGSAEVMLDTQVTAQGDISVSVSADRRSVGTEGNVTFHAIVHYTGDAPISGAHLDLTFPVHEGLNNIACQGQGVSQCRADGRTSNLHADFDLVPGGVADFSANFKPTASVESTHTGVQASVRGPIGLLEMDTVNNMARAPIVIGLFADSFE